MANEVQRYPFGLLDVLGIKGGKTPQSLSDAYVPVLQSGRFLARQNVTTTQTNNAAAAQGAGLDVTVPSGEVWFLTEAQVVCVEQVAMTVVELGLQLRYGGSAFFIASRRTVAPFIVGGLIVLPFFFADPVALLSGDGVSASLNTLGGVANANVTVSARYAKVNG